MDQFRAYVSELNEVRHRLAMRLHHKVHTGETVTHVCYCALVFMEGHGALSMVALGMGGFAILALFFGEGH